MAVIVTIPAMKMPSASRSTFCIRRVLRVLSAAYESRAAMRNRKASAARRIVGESIDLAQRDNDADQADHGEANADHRR